MYLVLDSASFHNPKKEDWKATATMTKNEFAAKLIENGVKSIEVERDSLDKNRNVLINTNGEPIKQIVTVASETFNKRASAKEPYAPHADDEETVELVAERAARTCSNNHKRNVRC